MSDSIQVIRSKDMTIEDLSEVVVRLTEENNRLVQAIDHHMIVNYLGVFNRGDDPERALSLICNFERDLGAFFAKQDQTVREWRDVLEDLQYHGFDSISEALGMLGEEEAKQDE